jgi:hypothetical protein
MSQDTGRALRGVRTPVSLSDERAPDRRTPDERLAVRFPALGRLASDAVMRMPPRFWLRRSLLARRVRRGYAAANRRDFATLLLGFDPAIEFHQSYGARLMPPDQEDVLYGHDGYRQAWQTLLDGFPNVRLEPEELLDLGDRFLLTIQMKASGPSSGIPVSERVFQLFTIRRGLIVRQEDFTDRAQALEAAGLSE